MRRLLPAKTSSFFEGLITRTSLLSSTPNCPSSSSDGGLPNARLVSHVFHTDDTTAEDNSVTHMVTQMGQFLDHDLVLTPEEDEHDCCEEFGARPSCFPIQIPDHTILYQYHSAPHHTIPYHTIPYHLDTITHRSSKSPTIFLHTILIP